LITAVPGGHHVAVEALVDQFVGHHSGGFPAVGRRFLLERRGAEDVVDVSVGVHGGGQPVG